MPPTILASDVPLHSVLDREWVTSAYFRDAYRAPLSRPQAGIVELFLALFAHHPLWLKIVLLLRNCMARACGLAVPTVAEVFDRTLQPHYRVGDKIGVWPLLSLTENELVVGRDNKHLDFRLSVLKQGPLHRASVTVSTVCRVHHFGGKLYLFFVVPFHRWGVQRLIADALRAGRL